VISNPENPEKSQENRYNYQSEFIKFSQEFDEYRSVYSEVNSTRVGDVQRVKKFVEKRAQKSPGNPKVQFQKDFPGKPEPQPQFVPLPEIQHIGGYRFNMAAQENRFEEKNWDENFNVIREDRWNSEQVRCQCPECQQFPLEKRFPDPQFPDPKPAMENRFPALPEPQQQQSYRDIIFLGPSPVLQFITNIGGGFLHCPDDEC
jgi:hypothetical protein